MEPPKLDWMYAGAAGHVNPEEYLTGRAVDKTFEQFKLGGCEPQISDLPPQLLPRRKTEIPNIQVDVARKIQGDPLLDIMQQQEERKAMLREQMLIQQRLASQSNKSRNLCVKNSKVEEKLKQGKSKRKMSSSSSSSSDLDEKLADKLKRLKEKKKEKSIDSQIAQKLKSLKKKKVSSSSSSSSSSSESEDEKSISKNKYKKQHKNYHSSSRERRNHSRSRERRRTNSQERRRSRSRERRTPRSGNEKRTHGNKNWKQISETKNINQVELLQQRTSMSSFPKNRNGTKLSSEELEKRRKEMMQEAVIRDQERRVQVEKYRKADEDEANQLSVNRPKEAAFVKKHLATVASNSTIESRIKSNVFNINRAGDTMDSNFARR